MKTVFFAITLGSFLSVGAARAADASNEPEVVHFQSQGLGLAGELFKPKGEGPFPAILYNHGSAPGMLNSQASKIIGPLFVEKGWVFFMPYRRGQGLSSKAGPYIGDQIAEAQRLGGIKESVATMTRLLNTEHLQDQLAALQWLKSQKFVQGSQIAVAGNSFGGIETVLGAARAQYCAAVDASGGAESWSVAPELQALMKEAVRKSNAPIFFFQAQNDFDLSPSIALLAEMKLAGKEGELRIYPSYGTSKRDGHSFAYMGSATWFSDVFAFVQKHCTESSETANPSFQRTSFGQEAVATLVTIADGTVSLYFSNGGGIIGVGQHEGPRKASEAFLAFAPRFITHAKPTTVFPLPTEGCTRFYFLCFDGVRTVEAKEDDLGNDRLPLSPLFRKAHEVITAARLVDEGQRAN